MNNDLSDIIISDIGFVIRRESDAEWMMENLVNKNYFLIIYALKGKAFYEAGGKNFIVSQGDVMFFNKGQIHSGYADSENPWTYYTAAFNVMLPDGTACDTLSVPMLTHTSNTEIYHKLYENMYYEWGTHNIGYDLCCRAGISELICRLARENLAEHKKSSDIENVKKYMMEHFTESFSIKKLAEIANVSQSHFYRVFRENTGISAKRYLNNIRINRAQALLQSGEYNVSEIAGMTGYSDIYYFSRMFKKITGVPPSAFIPR
jgi:AraC-like DNA-binding protein